ncbi:Fic/DOC family protein [Lactiplantibacillus carotarum]|uniref:Fic/DOC family protein n=1 Tax=Lactiplantibacillus carotarum TaxID=2993456 RepID=UPI00298F116C|nr:Fic family protein [Lactiplantibacillus carotarum]
MKNWSDYLQSNGTLKNKLGIVDNAMLRTVEYSYSSQQQAFLEQRGYKLPNGIQLNGTSVNELKLINDYLFGAIYDWAGHYREVDFNKTMGGTLTFFHPVELFGNAEMDIQRQLVSYAGLPVEKITIARALGRIVTTINIFHPFREGNGRTIRVFTQVLAQQKGLQLHFTAEQHRDYMRANIEDDDELMARVIFESLQFD